jgi:glutamate dehydrogenase/leucine dehydrogenase
LLLSLLLLLLLLQPLHLHGIRGRDTATGRGVLYAAREFLNSQLYSKVEGTTFVIQVSG